MMKRLSATAFVFFCLIGSLAFAAGLDEAKASGQVGERADGYIGAVASNPSAEIIALVDSVNRQRKEKYQSIAVKNGQSLDVVEKLAASKLKERLSNGQFYMDAGGGWKKK